MFYHQTWRLSYLLLPVSQIGLIPDQWTMSFSQSFQWICDLWLLWYLVMWPSSICRIFFLGHLSLNLTSLRKIGIAAELCINFFDVWNVSVYGTYLLPVSKQTLWLYVVNMVASLTRSAGEVRLIGHVVEQDWVIMGFHLFFCTWHKSRPL